jgi:3-oxoacyl-[acyl-carrier protein] reductase
MGKMGILRKNMSSEVVPYLINYNKPTPDEVDYLRGENKGKLTVVLGASEGIGAEAAKRFAYFGFDVAGTFYSHPEDGKRVLRAIKSRGVNGYLEQLDTSSYEQVDQVFERFNSQGPIRILVNNAGGPSDGDFLDQPWEDVDRIFRRNFLGLLRFAQLTARTLRDNELTGNIVWSGSIRQDSYDGTIPYTLSKAAMVAAAETMNFQYGDFGIISSVIRIGFTRTKMTERLSEAQQRICAAQTPLGEYQTATSVANAMVYAAQRNTEGVIDMGAGYIGRKRAGIPTVPLARKGKYN